MIPDTAIVLEYAPNAPCARRKMIIWSSVCARPHNADVVVKPMSETRNISRRPKRAASQPMGPVMIAEAMI